MSMADLVKVLYRLFCFIFLLNFPEFLHALPIISSEDDAKLVFFTMEQKYEKIPSDFIYISVKQHKLYFYSSDLWVQFVEDVKNSENFLDISDTTSIDIRTHLIENENDINRKILIEYPISKSEKPCSNKFGSGGTPLGRHYVKKIIKGEHPFSRFASRNEIGDMVLYHHIGENRGSIIGGIIVLAGEEQICESTEKRYIYIHGLFKISEIGETDFSDDCILMKPDDICHLCHYVQPETIVFIDND